MKGFQLIPEVGKVYMGQRVYNSKRIVWEPIRVDTVMPSPFGVSGLPGSWVLSGTWLLDGRQGRPNGQYTSQIKPFDKKWTAKKISDIDAEVAALQTQRENLRRISEDISCFS